MSFIFKEELQLSNGGGTLNVTVVNDEEMTNTLGAETTYGITLEQLKETLDSHPNVANIPELINQTLKNIRGFGE